MSTEYKSTWDRHGKVAFTQFYGGDLDGVCLQLTGERDYISLTKAQAVELAHAILQWTWGMREKEEDE